MNIRSVGLLKTRSVAVPGCFVALLGEYIKTRATPDGIARTNYMKTKLFKALRQQECKGGRTPLQLQGM